MSDERFDRDLRDEILRGVPTSAPADLRTRVSAIPDRRSVLARRRASFAPGSMVGLAAALVLVLVAGLLVVARPGPAPASSPATGSASSGVRALSAEELGGLLSSPEGATPGRLLVADLALHRVSYSCLPPDAPASPGPCGGWHADGLPGVVIARTGAGNDESLPPKGELAFRVQSATRLELLGVVLTPPNRFAWTASEVRHGGRALAVVDAWLGAENEPLPCPAPVTPETPSAYGCGHREWLADSPEPPNGNRLEPDNGVIVANGTYAEFAPDPSSANDERAVAQRAAYLVLRSAHPCFTDTGLSCYLVTVLGRIDPVPAAVMTTPSPSAAPSPTPSATAQATPSTAPEVDQFGLVDATHGWALSRNQLYLTSDDGLTWQWSAAVGSPDSGGVGGIVDVLDAEHGWLVRPDIGNGSATLEHTTDFGRSWQPATIPSATGIARTIHFFDPAHSLLALGGGAAQPGSLWRTSDGGAGWTEVGPIPAAVVGAISFTDATVGWGLATSDLNSPEGRPGINELFVTRDGGVSWQRSALPPPPPGFTAGAWLPEIHATPSAFDGGAVVSAWYGDWVHGETQLLVTKDAGRSWSVAATVPSLIPVPVDALTDQHWIAGIPHTAGSTLERLEVTEDAGRTWRAVTDLAPGGDIYLSIDFADAEHGWVLDNGTQSSLALFATDDGGASWRLLAPSGGPAATRRCAVDTVVLGNGGPLAPAPTPWFNVLVEDFLAGSPVTIGFDQPVAAFPGTPGTPSEPITTYAAGDGGTAKYTFRPADPGASRIAVTASGGGCTAASTVTLPSATTALP